MSSNNRCSIDIVGGGFGMLSVLDQLNLRNLKDTVIRIYSNDHRSVGDAYRTAPDVFLMNTKTSALVFFDHILSFSAWLAARPGSTGKLPDFIPRRTFGEYLSEVRDALVHELTLRNNRILFKGSALWIDADSRVHTETEIGSASDLVFLSPGYGSVLDGDACSRKIRSMKPGGPLRIVGTGLSAIDLILLTDKLRPDLEIECVSVTGRLPRVRSDFPVGGVSLLRSSKDLVNKPSLNGLMRELEGTCANRFERDLLFGTDISFSEEIAYVQENEPGWQAALYNATPDYASFFARLSAVERQFLFRRRSHFIEKRVMFPLVNALKLKDMIGCGKLRFAAKHLSISEMKDSDTVPAFNSISTLTGFIRASQLPHHKYAGIQCNFSGRVRDRRLIYALGPITNGVRYFTEASSLTVRHASLAVKSSFSRILKRQTAERKLAVICET